MVDLNSLKMVIFDNDGVLIDSWDATLFFFNTVRQHFHLPDMTPNEERFCFASTWQEGIKGTFPADLHARAMVVAQDIDPKTLIPMIRRQDRVIDFLRLTKGLGVKSAVMTNGGGEARLILQLLGLIEYFDPIITADDVTQAKPSGEGLAMILSTHQVHPRQAMFIGDSQHDCDAAREAGITFWAFNNPALKAETHIAGFEEAIQIFSPANLSSKA